MVIEETRNVGDAVEVRRSRSSPTASTRCQSWSTLSEIVTSLTESMVASIAHVLDYDNTPATDPNRTIDRVDNRILLSVGWSF